MKYGITTGSKIEVLYEYTKDIDLAPQATI